MNNMHISGSGMVPAGEYNEVHISGSGRYQGDIKCNSFHISGSASGEGNLTVEQDFHCSGSFQNQGDLDCGEAHVSGAAKIGGHITGRESIRISGALRCESIHGSEIKISGGLQTTGDVEGDLVKISGGGKIDGLLNAEEIHISVGGREGSLRIGSIGGSRIHIENSESKHGLSRFFSRKTACSVITSTIEGDELDLECTRADTVSGTNVHIGPGCEIERVEYSGNLTVDDGAVVHQQIKA